MTEFTSHVGWSQSFLVLSAVIGVWYFGTAVRALLSGTDQRAKALLSLGLGLVWMSAWAVYNPHDFAALVPYIVKAAFLLGCVAFLAGLGWSFVADFQLPWKRSSKHSLTSTQATS